MNGAAFAAASAFDRTGSAGYQTPAHRVSQTVAKKKQGPASGAAAKRPKHQRRRSINIFEQGTSEQGSSSRLSTLEHDPEKLPSGFDPMDGNRFSVKIMLKRTLHTVIRLDHGLDSQHDI